MENQREFYRIQYKGHGGPKILVGAQVLTVLDLSEVGASLLKNEAFRPDSEPVSIQVIFPDRTSIDVEAKYIREEVDRVVIRFSPSVPMRIILAEQRRIRRNSLLD